MPLSLSSPSLSAVARRDLVAAAHPLGRKTTGQHKETMPWH
jgi:hypothetical protein